MKTIGAMIMSALMTFAGKILTALGVGFITYKGLDFMQAQFASYINKQLGNIPADALQIFYMSGGGVFLNWIFGAVAFIATIKSTSRLTATMKKG